jgi:MarR family transcriptional regulator, lower aerobic nicotinate degradation pathway regulator
MSRRARADELAVGGAGPAPVQEIADAAHHPEGLNGLYSSPEYLIRRAHQVATAAFAEACADLDLTSSQYAALFALRQQAGVGQNALGRLIALDRSTTSLVVKSLKERGLVTAWSDPSDRRKTFLELSDKGRLVLAQAEKRNARSSKHLMSVLDPQQAQELLKMLRLLGDSTRPDDAA